MSHFIADVANPMHTDSSGKEDGVHSSYESAVDRRIPNYPVPLWHSKLDDHIAEQIRLHQEWGEKDFLQFLDGLYSTDELLDRFPNDC